MSEDKEPLKRDAFKRRRRGETGCVLKSKPEESVPGDGGSDRQEKKTKQVAPALLEQIQNEVAEGKENSCLT